MKPDRVHDVGLVLSGGGTRGIAHVGVLRALVERGIRPGCIAGASAGAIVGALHGAGYDPAAILDFFVRKNPFRLAKISLAKPGIIDTEKVVADFAEYFPDDSFAALDVELHVVATDLTRGEAVHFESGPLIRTVVASSSVPVMFTPMKVEGRILADGGIVSNFPAELIRGRCRVLLGSHVSPLREVDSTELGSSVSVLKRALEVGMFRASQTRFDLCDVLIHPQELSRFGLFDTRSFAAIEDLGYRAAVERMPAIREATGG